MWNVARLTRLTRRRRAMVLISLETSSIAARRQNIDGSNLTVFVQGGSCAVALAFHRRKGASSGAHAPQHFLYFLPLPHGHGSFLPVFGVAFPIWEEPAAGFRLALAPAWAVFFPRFWLYSRKHAHHPISAAVSSTRRR